MPQLVLGCAQLGLDYGIANSNGKPDSNKVLDILKAALNSGIELFDTAQAYGDSEKVLGKAFREMGVTDSVKVITKFSPNLDPKNNDELENSVNRSIEKLAVEKLECLMLHRIEWMEYLEYGLGDTLCEFRRKGKTRTLGVSVYTPKEAIKALESNIFDSIQAPCNAWDSGMTEKGVFELASKNRKNVYIRSAFLQGLLLMDSEIVKIKLPHAYEASKKWEGISRKLGIDKKHLAMAFVKNLKSPVVIGAETPEQIKQNRELFDNSFIDDETAKMISLEMKSVVNEKIINPAMW